MFGRVFHYSIVWHCSGCSDGRFLVLDMHSKVFASEFMDNKVARAPGNETDPPPRMLYRI
jgi:hypothetical protein